MMPAKCWIRLAVLVKVRSNCPRSVEAFVIVRAMQEQDHTFTNVDEKANGAATPETYVSFQLNTAEMRGKQTFLDAVHIHLSSFYRLSHQTRPSCSILLGYRIFHHRINRYSGLTTPFLWWGIFF